MRLFAAAVVFALLSTSAHAYSVYPGCTVPAPSGATWYVDPVNGKSPAAGGDGSQAHPWNDLNGIIGNVWGGGRGPTPTGYTRPLLSSIPYVHNSLLVADNLGNPPAHPGDTIILENGNYGNIQIGVFQHEIVNTDFVTIKADTNATPVFTGLAVESVNKFIFDGIKIQSLLSSFALPGSALVNVLDQGASFPTSDIIFNNLEVSSMDSITGLTQAQLNAGLRNGVRIIGAAGNGTNGQPGVSCISVTNSEIHNVVTGAVLFGNNTLFDSNHIHHEGGDGIEYAANNLKITNNQINDPVALSTGIHMDGMQGQIGQTVSGVPYNIYSNILIDSNRIYNQTDPTNAFPSYLQGIDAFDASWENMTITHNVVVASSCDGISMGSIHDSLIANNTVVDDGLIASPGCSLAIGAGGGTHEGPASTNTRIVNNLATHFVISNNDEPTITYDHNVALSSYQSFVHYYLASDGTWKVDFGSVAELGLDANGNLSPLITFTYVVNGVTQNGYNPADQFVTWSPSTLSWDLHLKSGSVAIGRGTPIVATPGQCVGSTTVGAYPFP